MIRKRQKASFILLPSSFILGLRVTDGTRTRDVQDHNLALCQLSYGHRAARVSAARRGKNILPQTVDVNIVATVHTARADGTRGSR
jgi:hypothetical protein